MAKKKEVDMEVLTMENLKEVIDELPVEVVEETAEVVEEEVEEGEVFYVDFDPDAFKEGIKIGSRLAGIFLSLTTAGMEAKDAADLVANERTIEHNIEVTKLNGGKIQPKVDLDKEVMTL